MKSKFLKTVIFGCSFAIAFAASAGPLQRAAVPENLVWVLHVDCDALRPTALGQYILSETEKPGAQKKIDAFETIFEFDPRKAIHGLTLYSTSKKEEDGVLLVYADFDSKRMTKLAKGAKEHKSSEHRRHVIHNWIDERKMAKEGGKPRTYAAIHEDKTIIFGQNQKSVAQALDVLDGVKTSLAAGKQFANLGAAGQKSFLQGAARKPEIPGSDPAASVLKQARTLTLDVSQSGNRFLSTLTMEAESEEAAKQVSSIANGILGLMSLQKEKPDSVKLAQGLAVAQNGADVAVQLNLLADEALEFIKNAAAQRAMKISF